jgi:hypothetical protein
VNPHLPVPSGWGGGFNRVDRYLTQLRGEVGRMTDVLVARRLDLEFDPDGELGRVHAVLLSKRGCRR